MERDSFVFYKSFADTIKEIPEEYQLEAYETIINYALTGTPPETDSWIIKAIFQSAKVTIDRAQAAYEAGRRGGRPRKSPETEEKNLEKGGVNGSKGGLPTIKTYEDVYVYEDVSVDKDKDVSEDQKEIKEKSAERVPSPEAPEDKIRYQYIIDNLNGKTGRNYRVTDKTRRLIKARINEGFTEEDFLKVIDNKVRDWLNDQKMSQYLRPETLFGTKFEGYLQETHRAYVSGDLPF